MHKSSRFGWVGLVGVLAASPVALGEIKLPNMFGDRAVLQRGEELSIWGWAEAGETVTVAFEGQMKSAQAGADGTWKVALDALKANATPQVLTVSGSTSESITVADVLVGEVWMASGQSNMQWSLSRTEGAKEEIAGATNPGLRMFLTDLKTAAEPQTDAGGQWLDTTPANAGSFSAVGYYYGKRLHADLKVPVGIIRTAWGGKPSEAFTTKETLASKPQGKALVAQWDERMAAFDAEKEQVKYEKKLEEWKTQVAAIKTANAVEGAEQKRLPRKPGLETAPNLSSNCPGAIYNAMVHPWVGYGMKGAIWYQGESNAGRAKQYETIFPLLIEDWRKQWKKELSFYFVQLANFKKPSDKPGVPDAWAELQNAQLLTLSLSKTGMAVINDIGMANNIHPTNKLDVGERLARWALAGDYGRKDMVVSGPLYVSSAVKGGKVRIKFKYAEGLKSRDGGALKRFEIAGKEQQWHWAEAVIEGSDVIVSSADVAAPVAVRYAWASNPTGANLVNGVGLPASLFRTDAWKLSTEK